VHWVFQLLLYAAWALAGSTGAILLATLLVLGTVAVLYLDARRFAPPTVVALLLAVALVVASPRFVPRPRAAGIFAARDLSLSSSTAIRARVGRSTGSCRCRSCG